MLVILVSPLAWLYLSSNNRALVPLFSALPTRSYGVPSPFAGWDVESTHVHSASIEMLCYSEPSVAMRSFLIRGALNALGGRFNDFNVHPTCITARNEIQVSKLPRPC